MPREEMARDLYLVDTLVSTKRRSSLNNVQENFITRRKDENAARHHGRIRIDDGFLFMG